MDKVIDKVGERASPAAVATGGDGWTRHEFDSVDSTNLVAANLPVWHAVRAEMQTAGRGRFQRHWISDRGGLWLSAVIPVGDGKRSWGLPLIAGLALCDGLRELGLNDGLRLRWPNDVLVHDRKLAGVLLDQFAPDRVVVGVGLNVRNHPERSDASLQAHTTTLEECLAKPPALPDLAALVLRHLRALVLESSSNGFGSVLARVNALWGPPRRVELSLDDGERRGLFTQVDSNGCLLLQDEHGQTAAFAPSDVRHLQEL